MPPTQKSENEEEKKQNSAVQKQEMEQTDNKTRFLDFKELVTLTKRPIPIYGEANEQTAKDTRNSSNSKPQKKGKKRKNNQEEEKRKCSKEEEQKRSKSKPSPEEFKSKTSL